MSAIPATDHGHRRQERESSLAPSFLGWGAGMATIGALGLIASLVLMFIPGHQGFMLNSWTMGFIFWILISLGCLGLNLLYYSVKGSWIAGILRLTEAGGSATMFLVFLGLALPIFFGIGHIYEWVHHTVGDHILMKKAPYLNVPGFISRSVIFLLFWAGLAYFTRKSSLRSDKDGSKVEEQWRSNYATPGLPFYVLTLTFALTDWGMSLTPHWSSTIYGVWLMIGGVLGALSLCTMLLCTNANRAPFSNYVAPAFTKDLGNMMFAFTMLWAYTSVSQLIIIWNGNLPEYASYYARRSTEWWNVIGMMTIVGQFMVPFLVLLSPRVKRYPQRLARIAGWIFVVHIIDVFGIIGRSLPERPWSYALPSAYDGLAFVTIGAIWFAIFCSQAKKAPLMAQYDRRLEEAKHHAH